MGEMGGYFRVTPNFVHLAPRMTLIQKLILDGDPVRKSDSQDKKIVKAGELSINLQAYDRR